MIPIKRQYKAYRQGMRWYQRFHRYNYTDNPYPMYSILWYCFCQGVNDVLN